MGTWAEELLAAGVSGVGLMGGWGGWPVGGWDGGPGRIGWPGGGVGRAGEVRAGGVERLAGRVGPVGGRV